MATQFLIVPQTIRNYPKSFAINKSWTSNRPSAPVGSPIPHASSSSLVYTERERGGRNSKSAALFHGSRVTNHDYAQKFRWQGGAKVGKLLKSTLPG